MTKIKLIFLSIFLFSSLSFGDWKNSSPTGNAQKPCPHDDAHRRERLAARRQVASMFQTPDTRGEDAASVDSEESRGDEEGR